MVSEIIKRDGRTVPFNETKIASAIFKAMNSCGLSDFQKAEDLAAKVCATFDGKNINKQYWIFYFFNINYVNFI